MSLAAVDLRTHGKDSQWVIPLVRRIQVGPDLAADKIVQIWDGSEIVGCTCPIALLVDKISDVRIVPLADDSEENMIMVDNVPDALGRLGVP